MQKYKFLAVFDQFVKKSYKFANSTCKYHKVGKIPFQMSHSPSKSVKVYLLGFLVLLFEIFSSGGHLGSLPWQQKQKKIYFFYFSSY